MKRSNCAALIGGLLLSLGCDQDTSGSDPVAGEAEAPHLAGQQPTATGPAVVAKPAGEPSWESLAGPLGDTREEAMAAAEARLETVGELVAEMMPAPGEAPAPDGRPWAELEARVDRVRRDVVRLGVATDAEWPAVRTDLEESFAAIEAMLRGSREPVG